MIMDFPLPVSSLALMLLWYLGMSSLSLNDNGMFPLGARSCLPLVVGVAVYAGGHMVQERWAVGCAKVGIRMQWRGGLWWIMVAMVAMVAMVLMGDHHCV
jgi:hypothetical protein